MLVLHPAFSIAQEASTQSQQALHGIIKYRLIDLETNKVISEATLYINQIYTEQRYIPSILNKYFEDRYVKIYDDFIVGLNKFGYKNKESVIGFGMWLKRLNQDVFSWEWYDQVNENDFKKRQGNGQLKVEYKKRDGYWEISKTTFIGDHIFRAKKKDVFSAVSPDKRDWHLIILNGSLIIW